MFDVFGLASGQDVNQQASTALSAIHTLMRYLENDRDDKT